MDEGKEQEGIHQESGQEYLARLGEEYKFYKNNVLPGLSDEAFEHQRRVTAQAPIGVGSFLADFAIGVEERRRAIERWTEGKKLPEADKKHIDAVHQVLPAFVVVNPEAIGAMRLESAKQYKIDTPVEDIMNEVTARLPRKIDAYRYHQGYVVDTIEVEGLGKVRVKMHESGDGVFRSISTIETDNFRVWNCRPTGVNYLDRFHDNSRPTEIIIKPLKLEVSLYGDSSGIYVSKDGKKYTNARWRTHFGTGYSNDFERDDLHRTYSGPNPGAPEKGYSNDGWHDDKTHLSWQEIEDGAIVWMVDNVLNPLRRSAKPESQEISPPEDEPFPEGIVGPLYIFIEMEDMEKISRIGFEPEKAYPDERKAVRPSRRLFSLGIPLGEGVPKEAYDGFIWCGVGEITEKTNMDQLQITDNTISKDRLFGRNEGLAVIKLKTATDVYIVDWQEWDNYRDRTFTEEHTRLTNQEFVEMYQAVGKTMVPITAYNGGYKKPVVLIGRDLELDEIERLHFPPEETTDLFGTEVTSF